MWVDFLSPWCHPCTRQSFLCYDEAFEKNTCITSKAPISPKSHFLQKIFGKIEGFISQTTKQMSLKLSLNIFSLMFHSSWHLPYPPLSQKPSQLPTLTAYHPSDCTQWNKAGQIIFSQKKPDHVLSLKHGLGAPRLALPTRPSMRVHTHMQPCNFSHCKVTYFQLIQSIVKFFLQFHVFLKSEQTNEFPYLPIILNARLNIPCLCELSLHGSILCTVVYSVILYWFPGIVAQS